MNRIFRNLILSIAMSITPVSAVLASQVNINTADAHQLSEELKGIGEKKARAIVTYREQNGPFAAIEQLMEIEGIGARTLEINKANIRLD